MNSSNNNNNNKFYLIAGAIAGAALTYFLQTPKGKKMTKDVVSKSKEFKDTIAEKAKVVATDLQEKASNTADVAAEKLSTLKEGMIATSVDVLEKTEDKVGGFQQGINKAKKNLKNGTSA